jgi:hypothetical protein
MKKPRGRRLSYANVAATLALVFAMSGGAYAAKSYLISSTGQISPKVLKKLKGNTGKAGAIGATGASGATGATGGTGAAGATGKEGPTGKEGKDGPRGPSEGLQAFKDSVGLIPTELTTIGTLTVPAGSYLVSAKLYVLNNEGTVRQEALCQLVNDVNSDKDETAVTAEPKGSTSFYGRVAISLQAGTVMPAGGHWIVSCLSTGTLLKGEDLKIQAIQVAKFSNTNA